MLCAAMVGCAGGVDPATPIVIRTPAPKNYEKTITNYLAFRIRNAPKNAEISVGAPEPGACALDGYATSTRGWVVPVLYVTRTGEVKEAIRIDAKQYYFWFLGNTIAGITPRMELCPGVGTGFESPQPNPATGALVTTALPATTNAEPRREEADGGRKTTKLKTTAAAKKSSASSAKARPAAKKKAANSGSKPKPS
jgi:hypothetical protein